MFCLQLIVPNGWVEIFELARSQINCDREESFEGFSGGLVVESFSEPVVELVESAVDFTS